MPCQRAGSGRHRPILSSFVLVATLAATLPARAGATFVVDALDASPPMEPGSAPSPPLWDASATTGLASGVSGDAREARVWVQSGEQAACSKRFEPGAAARAVVCRFNVFLSSDGLQPVVQVFDVGATRVATTGDGSDVEAYGRLRLIGSASGTGFRLHDVVADAYSETFEGTQAITWALNGSGEAVTYAAPDGTTESLADHRMDVWVGRSRVFDDAAVTSPGTAISELFWRWVSGAGTTSFGLLEARTLERVTPTAAAPAPARESAFERAVQLYRAWPNPSGTSVRYAYEVPSGVERVDIGVFDVAGRLVRSLARGTQPAGRYEVVWDGSSDTGGRVAGAVYFLRSSVGSETRVSRIVLVK